MTSKNNDSTLALVATAALASVATAVITHASLTRKHKAVCDQIRADAYEKDSSEKETAAMEQTKRGEPIGTQIPSLGIDGIYLWEVETLGSRFMRTKRRSINVMHGLWKIDSERHEKHQITEAKTTYNKLIGKNECILADITRKPGMKPHTRAYIRAGPCEQLHFDPHTVNAAIVTCGGLCPGLNNVIREIVNSLVKLYGTEGNVYGIRGGFAGFYDPSMEPILLDPEVVKDIHHQGGTFLSSSRGGFDIDKTMSFIEKHSINQLYVIGGDGTHRGAFRIHEECMKKKLNVAVAGIPKTIDNDVDHIDRSFGFTSAVEAALDAIRCAKVEAKCNLPNGVGIVKLMGRSAGFIAAHASISSSDVDLCLVPEVPTVLEGDNGCLPHVLQRVKNQGFAVIVVAEGAGEELLGESTETDASGNKKLPMIGEFMREKIVDYFRDNGEVATVKYIDPSYMIRSIPANASDSLYCMQLAQNAVHGAMAGYTGFSVGLCNNKMVLLPIPQLVAASPRMMKSNGRTWERVLALTRQPNTVEE